MLVTRIEKHAEKNHAPLLRRVATVVESMPGDGTVVLGDRSDDLSPRRPDETVVAFERHPIPEIVRVGANRCTVRYDQVENEAALAAGIACAALPGAPIVADPGSLALLALAERVARADIPVLIDGPTGTGKEVLSRFIHRHSNRADGPFVAINCAAMPEAMLEALLFGHRKGAFTGAANAAEGLFKAADGGTLLLDEIAEMPLTLQAKLLRALQEGEILPLGATTPVAVDVRIVASANRNLPLEVAEGRFREDLFYRLNVFPLSLPALRERIADIAPLAFAMLMRHTQGSQVAWIAEEAIARLQAHNWPGNIRELENVMRRALLLAGDAAVIMPEHISFDLTARSLPAANASATIKPLRPASEPRSDRLANIVRHSQAAAVADALAENGGNRTATARQLGISERTLRYRLADMREAGLPVARAAGAGR